MTREEQLKFHELQAMWWMHSATNKHACSRKMWHGFKETEMTDQEKINNAMETSKRHMDMYWEIVNK